MNYVDEFIEQIAHFKEQLNSSIERRIEEGEPAESLSAILKEYEAAERQFVSYITEFLMTMQASRMPKKLVMETVAHYQHKNKHGRRMTEILNAFIIGD